MKIAAVCTAYHEQDILPLTVVHLLDQGVDDVWILCPLEDSYPEIYGPQVHVVAHVETFHDQPRWIADLAQRARWSYGSREDVWIIPFDADEFITSYIENKTIRETIEELPDDIWKIEMPMFQQHDWWWREVDTKPMRKVAYRWCPDARVGPGNHSVTGLPESANVVFNALHVREIQYRGVEHFIRKVHERNATIDPSFPNEMGWHHRQYESASDDELREAFEEYERRQVIWDPIRTRIEAPKYMGELLNPGALMRLMVASPCDIAGHLQRLHDLAFETKTSRIIECGVNTGMSTIAFLATCLPVYSCDIVQPRVRPEVEVAANWYLHIGDDLQWDCGTAGLIFLDTSHTFRQTLDELKKFWPLVEPGGALAIHDTESYPDEMRAIKHWLHTVDDVVAAEWYSHDNGLAVFWK